MTDYTDALGHRAKIGVLVPFTNTIVQPEYEAMAPPGVTNHVARIPNRKRPVGDMNAYRASLINGWQPALEVIDRVTPAAPDLILLGHSIDSFVGGVTSAQMMQAALSERAGVCDVLVPSLAVDAALKALGGPRGIAILTPYQPPGDEAAQAFFSDAGYRVVGLKGLKCGSPLAIAAVTEEVIRAEIEALDGPDVEAIIQVGTNLAMARVAVEMEEKLGKPVLSINAATYWAGLRHLGINDRLEGFGRLLAEN